MPFLKDNRIRRLVVNSPLHGGVQDARTRACRFETIRLRNNAVGQVPTVAPPGNTQALGIGNATLNHGIDPLQNVLDVELIFVAHQIRQKLVALSRRAAIVRTEHCITLGSE